MVRPCHRHFCSSLELFGACEASVRPSFLNQTRRVPGQPGSLHCIWVYLAPSRSISLHLSMLLLFSGVQVAPSGRALLFPASLCSSLLGFALLALLAPLTLSPQPYPSMLLLPPPSLGFPALWTRHTRCVAKRPPSHWPLLKCRESGPLFSRLALGQRSLVWCYGLIRPRQRTLPS